MQLNFFSSFCLHIHLPEIQNKGIYCPMAYFGDKRKSYDVHYFTKNELISDVLKHYDRFLNIISEEKNNFNNKSES